jgi:hypothetical protein
MILVNLLDDAVSFVDQLANRRLIPLWNDMALLGKARERR